MKKTQELHKTFDPATIKEQYNKFAETANEFMLKIQKLKQDQEDFSKYMTYRNLFH
jgi:hypothetical protein